VEQRGVNFEQEEESRLAEETIVSCWKNHSSGSGSGHFILSHGIL
jgi:hypothetical protein